MTPLNGPPRPHRNPAGGWELGEARSWQQQLRARVEERDRVGPVRLVAGADVSYRRGDRRLYAGVVVLEAASLAEVERAGCEAPVGFPYLPGYLSLREAPPIVEAWSRLRHRPDLLFVDGHGVAHPRHCGIACHLGVVLDVPTIGVAKSVLVGEPGQPGPERGSRAPLIHDGAVLGTVLRTRTGVSPVFVSVGHRLALASATDWVLQCGAGYRLPEPTRLAHRAVNALRSGRTVVP